MLKQLVQCAILLLLMSNCYVIGISGSTKENLTLVLMSTASKFDWRVQKTQSTVVAQELNSNRSMSWRNDYSLQTKLVFPWDCTSTIMSSADLKRPFSFFEQQLTICFFFTHFMTRSVVIFPVRDRQNWYELCRVVSRNFGSHDVTF